MRRALVAAGALAAALVVAVPHGVAAPVVAQASATQTVPTTIAQTLAAWQSAAAIGTITATPTVREVAQAEIPDPIVWTDDVCRTPGHWDGSTPWTLSGCVTADDAIYMSPASLADVQIGRLDTEAALALWAVLWHEQSHHDVRAVCGGGGPSIAGDRAEHVTDAWAHLYRGVHVPTRLLPYGYTAADLDVARQIHEGDCNGLAK